MHRDSSIPAAKNQLRASFRATTTTCCQCRPPVGLLSLSEQTDAWLVSSYHRVDLPMVHLEALFGLESGHGAAAFFSLSVWAEECPRY